MIPFILGITGHRILSSNDLARIEGDVREQLVNLRRRMPDTKIVVVSAQAEGADRLVAKVAMKEGFEVWTLLPTEADEYERDFVTDESREEFRRLLENSTRVLNASTLSGRDSGSSDRPRIYVNVGNEICRLSHALLAVWDGHDSDKPGGTAQVVASYRTGRFDDAVRTGLAFPDCGMVIHVPVKTGTTANLSEGLHHRMLTPHLGDGGKPLLPGGENEFHRRFNAGLRSLNLFNRRCAEQKQKPDDKAKELLPLTLSWQKDAVLAGWLSLYAVSDADSYSAMKRRHRSLVTVVALFALSMMATLLYGGLITESYWPLLLGVGLLGAAYLVFRSHSNAEDDEIWIRYRALSEFLRVAISWRACGLQEPIHYVIADEQILPVDWLGIAARWIDNESRITLPTKPSKESVETVSSHWIDGQIDYFSGSKNKIDHHGKKAKKFAKATEAFIGLAIVADVLTMMLDYTLSNNGRDFALQVTAWTMYGYWALLSLSAVVAAYSGIMAHAEHESEYSYALVKFRLAQAALSNALDSAARRDLLIKLGKSALRETASWVRLHLGRPLRLPF